MQTLVVIEVLLLAPVVALVLMGRARSITWTKAEPHPLEFKRG